MMNNVLIKFITPGRLLKVKCQLWAIAVRLSFGIHFLRLSLGWEDFHTLILLLLLQRKYLLKNILGVTIGIKYTEKICFDAGKRLLVEWKCQKTGQELFCIVSPKFVDFLCFYPSDETN